MTALRIHPLPRRRGSIYAMVLGITMLITVIGIGALATSRVTTRASTGASDWVEAGAIALAAVEHAITKINSDGAASPTTWRNAYTSGVTASDVPYGDGRMKWILVDEDDGNFGDDYGDGIKVYGVGEVGSVRRVYSAKLNACGEGVDALRTAFHSAAGVDLSGIVIALNGPVSTNGNLTGLDKLRGPYTTEVAGSGGTAVAASKPMPSATVFDTYKTRATTINSSVAADGDMIPGTLSAADNPYGAENADGIYYIRLPEAVNNLNIKPGRYKCTLLIESAASRTNQTIELDDEMVWDPHKDEFPIIITKGISKFTIKGSVAPYYEGSTANLSELRGLIHCIGTTEAKLDNNTFLKGCLIADGIITTSGNVAVIATPGLLTKPPLGYSKGNRVVPIAGTWKWDATPAGWVSGN